MKTYYYAYYKHDNILSKEKYVFLDPFFMQFNATKIFWKIPKLSLSNEQAHMPLCCKTVRASIIIEKFMT